MLINSKRQSFPVCRSMRKGKNGVSEGTERRSGQPVTGQGQPLHVGKGQEQVTMEGE